MKNFYRSRTSNIIGGVCGGLGEYTRIDPVFWRIAFLLGSLCVHNAIFWAYIFLWIASTKETSQNLDE